MSVSVSVEEDDAFYRWSCEFVVAHTVFGTGFITVPVAGVHLASHPHSAAAVFFAVFAVFCTSVSLVVCCRFYAKLKRPPWPRWLSSSAGHRRRQEPQDAVRAVVGDEPPRHVPPRQTERPVAALAEKRIPASYEHHDGDGASECAVCLGEVGKGQKVRRLPACQHVFHEECIDLWLRAQATCPICRSSVTPPAPPERLPEVAVNVGAGHGQPSPTVTARPSIISSV